MHRNAKDFIVSTLSNQKQSTCCLRHVCSMSMSMSNEHSALPLIPIDIACTWLDSNRFSCEEGRLIFNWLHQNEWNARKHFENAIKREILLNNPFSVSTISNSLCILFFPHLLFNRIHVYHFGDSFENFDNHLEWLCCQKALPLTLCAHLVNLHSTLIPLDALFSKAGAMDEIWSTYVLPCNVFEPFNMTRNWNFHVNT